MRPNCTPLPTRKLMVLWLRFLTEINSNTKDIPSDLLNDPEIGKAVEELEISGFSDAELRAYDKFWDSVSVERTLIDDSYQKGKEKGKEEGIAEGMEKGRAEGKHEANTETAQRLLAMGISAEQVAKATQLPLEIIKDLSNS